MIVRLLAVCALVLTLGPASVASSATSEPTSTRIVSARDAADDVRILDDADDVSVNQKESIDIRVLKVDDLGNKVRFTAKLRRITSSKKFDQMVFIRMAPRRGDDWSVEMGYSPQQPDLGYATLFKADGSYVNCEPAPTEVSPPKQVALVVPNRCLPTQKARIRMRTYTGIFRSDAPPHSKDVLVVPGLHRLR